METKLLQNLQNTLQIICKKAKKDLINFFLAIFMILIGFTPLSVMADSDEQYLELKKIYDEQRWNLEKEFKEKFNESSIQFKEKKQLVYEKSKSDPSLTSEQINQMLRNAFYEFVDRQDDIKKEYASRVDSLNLMFKVKFDQFNIEMPLWVENVLELWRQGKISDVEFVNFLSFVINKDIINLEQWMFSDYND